MVWLGLKQEKRLWRILERGTLNPEWFKVPFQEKFITPRTVYTLKMTLQPYISRKPLSIKGLSVRSITLQNLTKSLQEPQKMI
jgi:hypothetical protein